MAFEIVDIKTSYLVDKKEKIEQYFNVNFETVIKGSEPDGRQLCKLFVKYCNKEDELINPSFKHKYDRNKSENFDDCCRENLNTAFQKAQEKQSESDELSITTKIYGATQVNTNQFETSLKGNGWSKESFKRFEVKIYCEELNSIICYVDFRHPVGEDNPKQLREKKTTVTSIFALFKNPKTGQPLVETSIKIQHHFDENRVPDNVKNQLRNLKWQEGKRPIQQDFPEGFLLVFYAENDIKQYTKDDVSITFSTTSDIYTIKKDVEQLNDTNISESIIILTYGPTNHIKRQENSDLPDQYLEKIEPYWERWFKSEIQRPRSSTPTITKPILGTPTLTRQRSRTA